LRLRETGVAAMANAITDVLGIKVGQWTNREAATGCTVVIAEDGATPGYHNAGGAPGTIETDLLRPENWVSQVHAVLMTGGSAYGLAAATGVRSALHAEGVGLALGDDVAPIPIVTGAVLFDLRVGRSDAYPSEEAGRQAVRDASTGPVAQGSVGAGTGCTVAKLLGRERALKGGLGTASVTHASGLMVGAIAAVNAAGDVYDADAGEIVAGPRGARPGTLHVSGEELLEKSLAAYASEAAERAGSLQEVALPSSERGAGGRGLTNTTLVTVATNARLDKVQATRLAIMADDGLSLAVRPAHTPSDGDTVFVLATGRHEADIDAVPSLLTLLGSMASQAVSRAIVNGVREATGLGGVPSVGEWRRAP
jgi:L-aminopeptidase/D-esterase-like protein